MSAGLDFENWTCPLPLRDYPNIVLAHGGGGRLSQELITNLIVPAFSSGELTDAALLPPAAGRLAFSTDAYVVRPLFFPGGSIAELAIHGTLNDLAMMGARPLYLSVSFVLEEGLPMADFARIVHRMGQAARAAGVRIVTGDTKVVERGAADQIFITTAGVGEVPDHVDWSPRRVQPGDAVLVSGTLGDHGMAIMSAREGLEFSSPIVSDSASLFPLVEILLAHDGVKVLRDPTRGGAAASLTELAEAGGFGVILDESRLPIQPEVQAACEILGLDPLHVANEGKLVAIVAPDHAESLLAALRAHPLGAHATRIGTTTELHPGLVTLRTNLGTHRVVPLPLGEQLPRIC